MNNRQSGSLEFRAAIGKILQRQRKHLNLYQEDVGKFAGVRTNMIYQYESGSCAPSIAVLFRLAHCLKLDWAELQSCLQYDYNKKLAAGPERPLNS